jgi:hypothetical protein
MSPLIGRNLSLSSLEMTIDLPIPTDTEKSTPTLGLGAKLKSPVFDASPSM